LKAGNPRLDVIEFMVISLAEFMSHSYICKFVTETLAYFKYVDKLPSLEDFNVDRIYMHIPAEYKNPGRSLAGRAGAAIANKKQRIKKMAERVVCSYSSDVIVNPEVRVISSARTTSYISPPSFVVSAGTVRVRSTPYHLRLISGEVTSTMAGNISSRRDNVHASGRVSHCL
jgi:hypothetical protein